MTSLEGAELELQVGLPVPILLNPNHTPYGEDK